MNKQSLIYVAGHTGLVGSAIVRELHRQKYTNILTISHQALDLTNQQATNFFVQTQKPEYVFMCAAMVGGIAANNSRPAEFIYNNLTVQTNLIHAACKAKVKKLLFLGSSCIYPKYIPQPIKEEYLLSAPLEPTNEAYAVAKIAGIKQCQSYNKQYGTNFISAMPTNLYGPNDNYTPNSAHVLPALIRRFHEAKIHSHPEVVVWGSGTPMREFLYVDDLAKACVMLMEKYDSSEIINIGSGREISIGTLAEMVKSIVGYEGGLHFDVSKPDGIQHKLLDSTKIKALGWLPQVDLPEGIALAYEDFKRSRV